MYEFGENTQTETRTASTVDYETVRTLRILIFGNGVCVWTTCLLCTAQNITTNWNSVFWIWPERLCSQTTRRLLAPTGRWKITHFPCLCVDKRATVSTNWVVVWCGFVEWMPLCACSPLTISWNEHTEKRQDTKRDILLRALAEKENVHAKRIYYIISEAHWWRDFSREQYWI